jgi:uroporphyrinogen-III synthase
MAVLVTRPAPDNVATASALRGKGFEALLAPALRFEALALPAQLEADFAAVILTSANALRAVEGQLMGHPLLNLPVFAVGKHTATAARRAGFEQVISTDGDAATLRTAVTKTARIGRLDAKKPLLYLAGADLARDLAGELAERGIEVVTHTVYRMVPIVDLSDEVCEAFAAGWIEAVLHYSAASARAFLDAARTAGVEVSALAVTHGCISATVAAVLREAGAVRVLVAASPDEAALLDALERSGRLGSSSGARQK